MLYKKEEYDDLVWAVWRVDESIDELESMLGYKLEDSNQKRLKERTAVRVLLKNLLGEDTPILYKNSGKPYLENGMFVSISHTNNYIAISLSENRETGIDIETISNKVLRVKNKFISEDEPIDPQNEAKHLLIHWSAKEALYKIIDRETKSLANDILVSSFCPKDSGQIRIADVPLDQKYEGKYIVDSDFVLVVI